MPECPHCNSEMEAVEMPMESTWGGEIHHVCLNDDCPYYKNSFKQISKMGYRRIGYRCCIDPRGKYGPYLVWSLEAAIDSAYLTSCGPRE